MTELPLSKAKLPNEMKDKLMVHWKSGSRDKYERLVLTCHFCPENDIRPRCFKLMKYIKKVVSSNLYVYDKSGYVLN